MSELTAQLSLVTSEEYKQWKSDTLATQNSHNVEIVQTQESERRKVRLRGYRMSLCMYFSFVQDPILNLDKRGDRGHFKIEVADGYR